LFGCKTQGHDRSQDETENEENDKKDRRMERDTGMIGWRVTAGVA
jgi:hypothetical protein